MMTTSISWATTSARAWGWTSARARGVELKIEEDLDVVGNNKDECKWVDELKGKGKGARAHD